MGPARPPVLSLKKKTGFLGGCFGRKATCQPDPLGLIRSEGGSMSVASVLDKSHSQEGFQRACGC